MRLVTRRSIDHREDSNHDPPLQRHFDAVTWPTLRRSRITVDSLSASALPAFALIRLLKATAFVLSSA
jgi:hypothetical protein